jgi:hypothetical protein
VGSWGFLALGILATAIPRRFFLVASNLDDRTPPPISHRNYLSRNRISVSSDLCRLTSETIASDSNSINGLVSYASTR